jgi:hypothetical protein
MLYVTLLGGQLLCPCLLPGRGHAQLYDSLSRRRDQDASAELQVGARTIRAIYERVTSVADLATLLRSCKRTRSQCGRRDWCDRGPRVG